MTLNNPRVDLVNENVYTKFGLILSIHSQDIEQNPNSDIKGLTSVANLGKMTLYNPNIDLVNDSVHSAYTKYGLTPSIHS